MGAPSTSLEAVVARIPDLVSGKDLSAEADNAEKMRQEVKEAMINGAAANHMHSGKHHESESAEDGSVLEGAAIASGGAGVVAGGLCLVASVFAAYLVAP